MTDLDDAHTLVRSARGCIGLVLLLLVPRDAAYGGTVQIIEEAEQLASARSRRAHASDRRQGQVPGDVRRAIELFRLAQTEAEQVNDEPLVARATTGLGAALLKVNLDLEGIAELERAIVLARRLEDRQLEIAALSHLSAVLRERGAFGEASINDQRLVHLGRTMDDPQTEISGWNGLCSTARRRGQFHEAIEAARRGTSVADAASAGGRGPAPHLDFAIRYCLGKSLINVADYASGMHHLQSALETATAAGMRGGVWHTLHDIGEWYAAHGDLHAAGRYYERALESAGTLPADARATTLGAMALVDEANGHYLLALSHHDEAIRLAGTEGYERLLAGNYIAMSRIFFRLGESERAAQKLALALAKAKELDQITPLITALLARGEQLGALDRIPEAEEACFEALATARAHGLRAFEPAALTTLAMLAEKRGDIHRARELYLESERAIQQIRSSIVSVQQRLAFATATRETYVGLVDVLLQLAREEGATEWLEQALLATERERSQNLSGALRGASVTKRRWSGDPEREDVERLVAELQLRLASESLDVSTRENLLRQLDDAERRLDLLERRLPASGWTVPSRFDPLRSALQPDEAFISYIIEERSWRAIVLAGGSLQVVDLPHLAELETRIEFFNSLLQSGRGGEALAAGRLLAATFLTPVLSTLPEATRSLIISAPGPAAAVPIGVLPDPHREGRPLLDRLQVSYTPSLSFLAHLRRRPLAGGDSRLLALAFPGGASGNGGPTWRLQPMTPLRWATDEVRSIAVPLSRAGADLLMDRDASERNLKRRPLSSYRAIHLAAHAFLDPDLPARSAILLDQAGGEDGFLQPREIYSLLLNGQLVVLSGCETAGGRSSGADGMQSLARAFLYAGAGTVVGSLWKIEDRMMRDLMTAFYQELATGQDVGAALAAARLKVSGDQPYDHSAAWAGIVIIGDSSVRPFTHSRPMLISMERQGWFPFVASTSIIFLLTGILVVRRRRV